MKSDSTQTINENKLHLLHVSGAASWSLNEVAAWQSRFRKVIATSTGPVAPLRTKSAYNLISLERSLLYAASAQVHLSCMDTHNLDQ